MNRPPFGTEKEVTVCDACGDRLVLPPGVIYRGEKLHKHCAKIRRQADHDEEILGPLLDDTEERLRSLLSNTA